MYSRRMSSKWKNQVTTAKDNFPFHSKTQWLLDLDKEALEVQPHRVKRRAPFHWHCMDAGSQPRKYIDSSFNQAQPKGK